MTRDEFAIRIATVITIVWCASLILDGADPKYDPPTSIHGAMMLVAGWLFVSAKVGR